MCYFGYFGVVLVIGHREIEKKKVKESVKIDEYL